MREGEWPVNLSQDNVHMHAPKPYTAHNSTFLIYFILAYCLCKGTKPWSKLTPTDITVPSGTRKGKVSHDHT